MSFLSKIFKNNEEVQELENEISSLKKEIIQLKVEIEKKNKLINSNATKVVESAPPVVETKPKGDYSKQWELMEKNLRNLQEENRKLKASLLQVHSIIPNDEWTYSYLVDLHVFYSGNKFVSIREILAEHDIKYLQEIQEEMFSTILKDEKHVEEALKKYNNYKKGIIDWEVKTFLLKGDKITKPYQKYRKLLNILSDKNIEFMKDLEKFDFKTLSEFGFSDEDINIFEQKYLDYNSERKIK